MKGQLRKEGKATNSFGPTLLAGKEKLLLLGKRQGSPCATIQGEPLEDFAGGPEDDGAADGLAVLLDAGVVMSDDGGRKEEGDARGKFEGKDFALAKVDDQAGGFTMVEIAVCQNDTKAGEIVVRVNVEFCANFAPSVDAARGEGAPEAVKQLLGVGLLTTGPLTIAFLRLRLGLPEIWVLHEVVHGLGVEFEVVRETILKDACIK